MKHYQFDWLGKDWQKLKKQLVVLSVAHSGCFSDDNDLKEDLSSFVSSVLNDIKQRIPKDEMGLWQEALPLFTNFELLHKTIADGSKSTKNKDLSFKQSLGQSLRYFFEDARRELLALEIDDSPSKIKSWERLNRLSSQVAKKTLFDSLCSEEYFEYLLNIINKEYKGDYNYPHKLDTIRQYFFKFSPECKKLEIQADDSQINHYAKNDVFNVIGEELFGSEEKEVLQQCLLQLDKEDLEVLDVAFGLEINTMQYQSEKTYQKAKKLNKRKYEEVKTKALTNLNTLFDKYSYEMEQ